MNNVEPKIRVQVFAAWTLRGLAWIGRVLAVALLRRVVEWVLCAWS